MSITSEHPPFTGKEERNWAPLVAGGAVVLAIAVAAILSLGHGKAGGQVTAAPVSAPLDPYAASLRISNLAMSESSNLAGGKLTYVDGEIANTGSRAVSGVTVQVLFRDFAHEVAQNETQPLELIRTRTPYVDLEPVFSAPIQPGGAENFRLIFDTVSPDWDGAYPEIRILHVETK